MSQGIIYLPIKYKVRIIIVILNLRSGKIEGFPQKTRINLVNVSNTYWTVVCRYSIINGCIYLERLIRVSFSLSVKIGAGITELI